MLVSIDPGVRGLGLARFEDGVLKGAGYVRAFEGDVACVGLTDALQSSFRTPLKTLADIDELVIEKPKVYDVRHQKGDQRDIVDLAIAVGSIVRALSHACVVTLVEPSGWKGQTPKAISVERTIKALSPNELAQVILPRAKKLQLDVWDAIGIGLWRLGRDRT